MIFKNTSVKKGVLLAAYLIKLNKFLEKTLGICYHR